MQGKTNFKPGTFLRSSFFPAVLAATLCSCQQQKIAPPANQTPSDAGASFEMIDFTSTPSGAAVKLSSGEYCTTPCKIRKNLDSRFTATFTKEGYASVNIEVMNNLERLKKYNREHGGKTDNLRVANFKFTPNPVAAQLEPVWSK